jgi:hypothetical protein
MGVFQSTLSEADQLAELKRSAVHSGYIYKQSRWLQEWHRRYYMMIYNEEKEQKEILFCHDAHSLPTVTIRIGSLQGYGSLAELSVAGHPYCICICQAGSPVFLSAKSEEERGEFVSMLRAVLPRGTPEEEREEAARVERVIEDFRASISSSQGSASLVPAPES